MHENKILGQGLEVPDRKKQIHWFKAIVLAFISLTGFALTWTLLAMGFTQSESLLFWIYPILTAALGVTFLGFLAVVNRNKGLYAAASFLIVGSFVLIMPKNWLMLVAAALFFGLSFLFDARIKHDEKSRADFSFSRVLRGSRAIMVYALLLTVGFIIYAEADQAFKNNPKQFYNQIGHYSARGLQFVPSGLGNFNPGQRFDEFVLNLAKRQEPGFEQASDRQKRQLFEEVKKQLMERYQIQIFGSSRLDGESSQGNPFLGEVVAGWVSEKVESAASSYENFFPLIFAIIAIALLRSVSFVFIWVLMLISWTSFKLLLLVKFFKLTKVPVEVEKLEI